MSALIRFAAAALLACLPSAASADPAGLLALQRYDRQLAAIGYRLAMAGGDLCAAKAPMPGFALHDLSQYSAAEQGDARAAFGFGADPLVLAVAPTSPAAAAGLREGDAVLSVDGDAVPAARPRAQSSYARMAALLARLDESMAEGMLLLTVRRGGRQLDLRVPVRRGCASRFQIKASSAIDSHADGTYVEINTGLVDFARDEDQIAAIVAHELAHNILRHRARLDAKGIRRGLLGQFGRSARMVRQTEEEADRLAVYLLDRAGYSPRAIVAFWERFDRTHSSGFLSAQTHRTPRDRIVIAEQEIARIASEKAAGRTPRPAFMSGTSLPELR